ncbi:MAG: PRC-barrel domain-containing protein, partial [Dongiaceae bacterium]
IASGGFLGIGEKLIAVDFSQLTLPGAAAAAQANDANGNAVNGTAAQNGVANGTAVDQNGNPVPNAAPALARNDDVAVIAGLTQEQVKDLPDFRYDPSMRTANQVANGNLASAPASTATGSSGSSASDNGVAATTGNDNAGATASIDRNAVDLKQLIGKVVVDANGDRVGTVDNVLMDANGERPEQAVIASGGFLGIGKKLIAVDFSQLKIGDDGRAHVTGLTREQVRDMKDFRYDPSMRTYHNSAS